MFQIFPKLFQCLDANVIANKVKFKAMKCNFLQRTILLLVECETKSFQGFYLIPKMMSPTKIVESTVLDDKRKDAYRRNDG